MRNHRFFRRLSYVALFFTIPSGCQVFHSCRPVSVLAVDAETKKPIAGAEVRISYPLTPAYRAPAPSSGKTGADGVAELPGAPADEGLAVETTATGYLYEQKSFNGDVIPASASWALFSAPAPRVAPLVLELYAEPGPSIELALPAGYHGIVRVQVEPRDDVPCPPGQRRFQYPVPESGEVQAVGPALLRRNPAVTASYPNGIVLSSQVKDDEVGFLWVKSDGGAEIYVVGTTIERDSLRRLDLKNRPSVSGQKPAQGHKGRHGGQPGADAGGDSSNP